MVTAWSHPVASNSASCHEMVRYRSAPGDHPVGMRTVIGFLFTLDSRSTRNKLEGDASLREMAEFPKCTVGQTMSTCFETCSGSVYPWWRPTRSIPVSPWR